MLVSELIVALADLPQDGRVVLHYDGAARINAEAAWLAQDGAVVIAQLDGPVYDDSDRIAGALTQKESPYLEVWEMLGMPKPTETED